MNIENTTEVKKRAQVQISSFTGPLPPPEILKSYDSIVDGAASRIIKMAEIQADHRRALEWKSREYEHREFMELSSENRFAATCSAIVVCVALVGGILIAIKGDGLLSYSVFIAELIGLGGLFVYAKRQRKSDSTSRLQTKPKKGNPIL